MKFFWFASVVSVTFITRNIGISINKLEKPQFKSSGLDLMKVSRVKYQVNTQVADLC